MATPNRRESIGLEFYNRQLLHRAINETEVAVTLIEAVIEIPPGGTAGQVLRKVDGDDYNVEWATP